MSGLAELTLVSSVILLWLLLIIVAAGVTWLLKTVCRSLTVRGEFSVDFTTQKNPRDPVDFEILAPLPRQQRRRRGRGPNGGGYHLSARGAEPEPIE